MPKIPYNNPLFDHINGFESFLIFWVLILSYLPRGIMVIAIAGTTKTFVNFDVVSMKTSLQPFS